MVKRAELADKLLIAAVNRRVQRGARSGSEISNGASRKLPRCAVCTQVVLDGDPDDSARPWFCSHRCFRIYRDHLHGNAFDEHHRKLDCGVVHGVSPRGRQKASEKPLN